jgi:hypothetical protein
MNDKIPAGCRRFRAAIIPLILFFLAAYLLLFFCFVLAVAGWHFDRHAFGRAVSLAPILAVVCALMLSNGFPTAVSAKGIYGHSFWGSRQFVEWRDVSEVRAFRLANLRWLRIYGASTGKVTWLALFQSQNQDFQDEIRSFAPPGSPVLKFFL